MPLLRNKYVTIVVLLLSNLLNYVDRYTVAGVLPQLEAYFGIGSDKLGLLQTCFLGCYTLSSPVYGYIGDRYNRIHVIAAGKLLWVLAVLGSTFVQGDHYWIFFCCRGVVGIGEAAVSNIAPTIIADLFTGRSRTVWTAAYFLMIPIGSGAGFMLSSNIGKVSASWEWGIRATTPLGALIFLALLILVKDPERGAAEKTTGKATSLKEDLCYLIRHKSFICTTIAQASIFFGTGSLSWFLTTFAVRAHEVMYGKISAEEKAGVNAKNGLYFGGILVVAGIVGVIIGAASFWLWKEGKLCFPRSERSGMYICALGSLVGAPFFFVAISAIEKVPVLAWIALFIAITCLCFNWAVNVDVLMSIIVVNRRSFANSVQCAVAHTLGDVICPYNVGLIETVLKDRSKIDPTADPTVEAEFYSMRNALYVPNAVLVISFFAYGTAAFFVEKDIKEVEKQMQEDEKDVEASNPTQDSLDKTTSEEECHSDI